MSHTQSLYCLCGGQIYITVPVVAEQVKWSILVAYYTLQKKVWFFYLDFKMMDSDSVNILETELLW